MLQVSGVERVSRTTSRSERRRTLTYPARVWSVKLQVLGSCGTYRVHPCWFRSSASRRFRKLPPIQTPLLFLQRSSCLTTTETGNGTEGRTTGSKTIIRRGTTVPGEAPAVGMTTTTQRGSEGNTTMGSISSRTLFHYFVRTYLFQGYDGQKAYDDYNGGYSKRNDQGHGGGEGYTKKRLVPSEASPHVIFLGLDPDFTESDVSFTLSPHPRLLRILSLCSSKHTSSATAATSSRSR